MSIFVEIHHYDEDPSSPALAVGKEAIRYHLAPPREDSGMVMIEYAISYAFPEAVVGRYREVSEALSIVWVDLDDRSVTVTSLQYDDVTLAVEPGPLCRALPPRPLPPGDASGDTQFGGFVKGAAFRPQAPVAGRPTAFRPRLHSYVVLESYFSNAIAIDLSRGEVRGVEPLP